MDVFIATGEISGDRLAVEVASELRRRFGEGLSIWGMTGPQAAAAGIRQVLEPKDFSMVAVRWRVLSSWSAKLAALVERLAADPPRLLVAVAHPTFNLPLAGLLPDSTYKILIEPPEIWGWETNALARLTAAAMEKAARWTANPYSPLLAGPVAARRAELSLRNFDELLCLTPMTAEAFRCRAAASGGGAKVRHLRHPASLITRDEARGAALREKLGLAAEEHLLAIFPGSRGGEINLMLPTHLKAAARVAGRRRDVRVAVSVADERFGDLIRAHVRSAVEKEGFASRPIVTDASAHDLLTAACHSILASGTLTLEAAMLGAAGTIGYTAPFATRFLLRPFFRHYRLAGRRVPFALPNVLWLTGGGTWDSLPYPEVTLRCFTPTRLADAVSRALPAGPHGASCPPRLPGEIIPQLRRTLCPNPPAPLPGQYISDLWEALAASDRDFSS